MQKRAFVFLLILVLAGLFIYPVIGQSVEKGFNRHYRSFENVGALKAYLRWSPGREPFISAHRGGPEIGFPENAVETFEHTLTYGPCLIECDVRVSRDGQLFILHDDYLNRTTTGQGRASAYTLANLKSFFLKDQSNQVTQYRIPSLGEVLTWARGKAILTLDVKRKTSLDLVVGQIRKYRAEGYVVVIVYTMEQMKRVHEMAPDLVISVPVKGKKGVEKLFSSGVPVENLVVFIGVSEPEAGVYELLHREGIRTILGTMHNLDNKAEKRGIGVYQELYRNGADILSTDRVPEVSRAIVEMMSGK